MNFNKQYFIPRYQTGGVEPGMYDPDANYLGIDMNEMNMDPNVQWNDQESLETFTHGEGQSLKFEEALQQAKSQGLENFWWQGEQYSTANGQVVNQETKQEETTEDHATHAPPRMTDKPSNKIPYPIAGHSTGVSPTAGVGEPGDLMDWVFTLKGVADRFKAENYVKYGRELKKADQGTGHVWPMERDWATLQQMNNQPEANVNMGQEGQNMQSPVSTGVPGQQAPQETDFSFMGQDADSDGIPNSVDADTASMAQPQIGPQLPEGTNQEDFPFDDQGGDEEAPSNEGQPGENTDPATENPADEDPGQDDPGNTPTTTEDDAGGDPQAEGDSDPEDDSEGQPKGSDDGEGKKSGWKDFKDSKGVQTAEKIAQGAVDISRVLNATLEKREAKRQKREQMKKTMADNVYQTTEADISGQKGDYDPNTGIFRQDDKVMSRQGKYGTEIQTLMQSGGSWSNADWIPQTVRDKDIERTWQTRDRNNNPNSDEFMPSGSNQDPFQDYNYDVEYWNPEGTHPYGKSEKYQNWYDAGDSSGSRVLDSEGNLTHYKKGPWEGYYSGQQWSLDEPLNFSEKDYKILIDTMNYNPKLLDRKGKTRRIKDPFPNQNSGPGPKGSGTYDDNRHIDDYVMFKEVMERNSGHTWNDMQLADAAWALKRKSTRGGWGSGVNQQPIFAEGLPRPQDYINDPSVWTDYGDAIYADRINNPNQNFLTEEDKLENASNDIKDQNITSISLPTKTINKLPSSSNDNLIYPSNTVTESLLSSTENNYEEEPVVDRWEEKRRKREAMFADASTPQSASGKYGKEIFIAQEGGTPWWDQAANYASSKIDQAKNWTRDEIVNPVKDEFNEAVDLEGYRAGEQGMIPDFYGQSTYDLTDDMREGLDKVAKKDPIGPIGKLATGLSAGIGTVQGTHKLSQIDYMNQSKEETSSQIRDASNHMLEGHTKFANKMLTPKQIKIAQELSKQSGLDKPIADAWDSSKEYASNRLESIRDNVRGTTETEKLISKTPNEEIGKEEVSSTGRYGKEISRFLQAGGDIFNNPQLPEMQSGGSARSVFCSSCNKSYYPCPPTRTDAECCKAACGGKKTILKDTIKEMGGRTEQLRGRQYDDIDTTIDLDESTINELMALGAEIEYL
tara:strand:- start:654 stop:4043 length:3390 start_codon:yes stop_codon:yes gene_type:complete